jgi:hypothetical protein
MKKSEKDKRFVYCTQEGTNNCPCEMESICGVNVRV